MQTQINVDQKQVQKIGKVVKSRGFFNYLMALAKFIMPFQKRISLEVNMSGGSYTDGNHVVVGIPHLFWNSLKSTYMAGQALMGHEIMHVIASDFPAFMDFQEEVYQFFRKNYGLTNGRKFGAQILNSTEDGRIEKRLVNRLKGMLKYIKFLNGVAWDNSPVTGENMLMEYTLNVCYMATSGIWMQGFDEVYGGTRMEEELEKVKPLIIKAINQPTTKACGVVTMEIIKANADFIAEMLDPANQPQQDEDGESGDGEGGQGGDPTDSLDRADAPTTTRAMNEDDLELTESSHFVDEEENQKPKPSPSNSADADDSEDEGEADEEEGSGKGDAGEENEEETQGQGSDNDSDETGDDENDDQSDGDSQSGDDDSQSNNQDQSDEKDNNQQGGSVNGGDDGQDSSEHPEENKSIEDLIREAVEEVAQELEEESEKAIEQTDRDNEKIEREENRINEERKKVELTEKDKGAILNLPNGVDELTIRYEDGLEDSRPIHQDLKNKTRTFRKEVEKIFLNKQGFNKKNRRQGRLDVNQIWRVTTGDVDLFAQKGRPQDSDYAVSVLVDNSGSMSERIRDEETGKVLTKAIYAKEAVITLEEGLKGIVPLQITQFDYNYTHGIHHKIIRSYEDKSDNNRTQERVNPDRTGGGNGDGYSIKIAHRQLMKRPERQKVMFVLSDGEPSSYSNYHQAYAHVNEAVKEARADGVIVIAIRFGTPDFLEHTADAYREMYEHSYLACVPAEMRKELIKLMKQVIK